MPSQSDQTAPPPPDPGSGDEEVILLTEVLEEAPSEVVLEISPGEGLEALRQAPPELSPPPEAPAESLDEFLASLEDLPAPPAAAPLEAPEASPLDAGDLREAVRQELALMLQEGELQAAAREAIQETVADLCRELFPPVAREVIGQEIEALKKRLAGIQG